MPVTVDQANVAQAAFSAAGTGGSSFNTSATVASGGMIAVLAGRFNSGTPSATLAMSGGGLTWATGHLATSSNIKLYLFYAFAPSGLASGTALTITNSAGTADITLCATSYLGIDSAAAPVAFNAAAATATGWASGTVTAASGNVLIGGAWEDGALLTSTPTGPAVERQDFNSATTTESVTLVDKIGVVGSDSLAGTWSSSAAHVGIGVAFQAAAATASSTRPPTYGPPKTRARRAGPRTFVERRQTFAPASTTDTATMGVATTTSTSPTAQTTTPAGTTATATGTSPTAAAAATRGTAPATGITPNSTTAATPTPGTATTTSVAPTARATATSGTASTTSTGPTAAAALTRGTATGAGIAPTDGSSSSDNATPGTATGTGITPVPAIQAPLTRGTATGAGVSPTDTSSTTDTAPQGVATATGIQPGATIRLSTLQGVASTVPVAPTPTVTLTRTTATTTGTTPGQTTAAIITTGLATGQGIRPTISLNRWTLTPQTHWDPDTSTRWAHTAGTTWPTTTPTRWPHTDQDPWD